MLFMRTKTQFVMLTTVLASMVAPASAMSGMSATPEDGDESHMSLGSTSVVDERSRCVSFMAQQPSDFGMSRENAEDTKIVSDWSVNAGSDNGFAQREDDQRFIKTADGVIGVYTSGDVEKYYECHVVKMSNSGSVLWEKTIQPGEYTIARGICEGADGTVYVTGETSVDGATHIYVAGFSADGTAKFQKVLDEGYAAIQQVYGILPYNGGAVVVFDTPVSGQKYMTNYQVVSAAGVFGNSGSMPVDMTVWDAYVHGDSLLIVNYTQITGVNLLTGEVIAPKTFARIQSSLLSGDTLYLLTRETSTETGSVSMHLSRYTVSGETLTRDWIKDLELSSTNFLCTLYQDKNSDVYALVKYPQAWYIAKVTPQGEVAFTQDVAPGDSNVVSGFCYSFCVDDAGNYIFAGMGIDFKVFISKLSPQFELLSCHKTIVDDSADFTMSASRMHQSMFDGSNLIACGFIRKSNMDLGYYPFLAQWNVSGNEAAETWKHVAAPGNITRSRAIASTVDATGDVYAIVNSNNSYSVVKYDAAGTQLWAKAISDPELNSAELYSVKTLSNGNIVVSGNATIMENGSKRNVIPVWCMDSNGGLLWKQYKYDQTLFNIPQTIDLIIDSSDNIYAMVYAYKPNYSGSLAAVAKYSSTGEELWLKTFPYESGTVYPRKGIIDKSGNLVIAGYRFSNADGGVFHPTVMKVTPAGELAFMTSSFDDSAVAMQYTDVWADDEGNIFTAGTTGQTEPIYAKYDAQGVEVFATYESGTSGYFLTVSGYDDNVVLVGTRINQQNVMVGYVRVIDKNGNEVWNAEYENGKAQLMYIAPTDPLVFVGYYVDANAKAHEVVVNYSKEGNLINELTGEPVSNSSNGYSLTSVSGNGHFLATTSYTMIDKIISKGFARRYTLGVIDGVENVNADKCSVLVDGNCIHVAGDGVTSLGLYDLSGRRVARTAGSEISTQGVAKGIYLLEIETASGKAAVKVAI